MFARIAHVLAREWVRWVELQSYANCRSQAARPTLSGTDSVRGSRQKTRTSGPCHWKKVPFCARTFFRAMHPMRSHIVYISFYSSFVIFLFFRFSSRSALVTFVCVSISGSTLIVFFSCHCCNNTPWPFFWTCKPIFLGAFICFVKKMQKAHVYFCPIFSKPRTGDTLYTADLWYTKSVWDTA